MQHVNNEMKYDRCQNMSEDSQSRHNETLLMSMKLKKSSAWRTLLLQPSDRQMVLFVHYMYFV